MFVGMHMWLLTVTMLCVGHSPMMLNVSVTYCQIIPSHFQSEGLCMIHRSYLRMSTPSFHQVILSSRTNQKYLWLRTLWSCWLSIWRCLLQYNPSLLHWMSHAKFVTSWISVISVVEIISKIRISMVDIIICIYLYKEASYYMIVWWMNLHGGTKLQITNYTKLSHLWKIPKVCVWQYQGSSDTQPHWSLKACTLFPVQCSMCQFPLTLKHIWINGVGPMPTSLQCRQYAWSIY